MGTAVLSPQDCFVSPHGGHSRRFKEMMCPTIADTPKSRKNVVQAAAMHSESPQSKFSSTAFSLVEGDVMKRLNDSPGLLPLPASNLESRHSPSRKASLTSASALRRVSSISSSRSRQLAASPSTTQPQGSGRGSKTAPTSSSNSKYPSSRSLSAGVLASRGSQISRAGELAAERAFQSNCESQPRAKQYNHAGNRAADKIETPVLFGRRRGVQASKFLENKRYSHKKRIIGCESVGDLRKRTHADFVSQHGVLDVDVLPRNESLGGGDGINSARRESEGQKIGKMRETDRGFSRNEGRDQDDSRSPGVTILQRPKDKDAAVELIARFFKKVEAVSVIEEVDVTSQLGEVPSMENCDIASNENMKMNNLTKIPTTEILNGIPEVMNVPTVSERLTGRDNFPTAQKVDSSSGVSIPRHESIDSQIFCRAHLAETMEISPCETDTEDLGVGEISKYITSIYSDDKWLPMFFNERWAGPAFTNSPPPSCLPLPRFPMKQIRASVQNIRVGNQSADEGSWRHPPPPGAPPVAVVPSARRFTALGGNSPIQQGGICDVTFATKDLRRLLNLDGC